VGEEEKQSTGYTTPDGTEQYATYFRDGTTNGAGQDYANARYTTTNFGSLEPGPAGTSAVDYKNPTSWNVIFTCGQTRSTLPIRVSLCHRGRDVP